MYKVATQCQVDAVSVTLLAALVVEAVKVFKQPLLVISYPDSKEQPNTRKETLPGWEPGNSNRETVRHTLEK